MSVTTCALPSTTLNGPAPRRASFESAATSREMSSWPLRSPPGPRRASAAAAVARHLPRRCASLRRALTEPDTDMFSSAAPERHHGGQLSPPTVGQRRAALAAGSRRDSRPPRPFSPRARRSIHSRGHDDTADEHQRISQRQVHFATSALGSPSSWCRSNAWGVERRCPRGVCRCANKKRVVIERRA